MTQRPDLPEISGRTVVGVNSNLRYASQDELNRNARGKQAIVTGANVGQGYEIALALAKAGCNVVLACRNEDKAEAAADAIRKQVPDAKIEVMLVDFASLASVRSFAKQWGKECGALDLLLLNAGLIVPQKEITEDGNEMSFQVNCLGPFLLNILLLPYLAMSSAPRVCINWSESGCHGVYDLDNINLAKTPETWWFPMRFVRGGVGYRNAKFWQMLALGAMQDRLSASSDERLSRIVAVLAHPGMVDSDMSAKSSYGLPTFVTKLVGFVLGYIARTSAQGAQTCIYTATADELGQAKCKGSLWADCHQYALPAIAYDQDKKDALWPKLCELAGLREDCASILT